MKKFLAALLFLVPLAALSQSVFTPYSKTYQVSITTSASTGVQVLPNSASVTNCTNYQVINSGSKDVWVTFGGSAVAATIPSPGSPTGSALIQSGSVVIIAGPNNAYISGITSAGTSTLDVSCGQGALASTTTSTVTGTFTPSGTIDENVKQVNGATVNVGTGAAGTGTQRVTTSTDSTIATITNPVGIKGSDGSTIASSSNPVSVSPAPSSQTNSASTITTGGTFQTISASSVTRQSFDFVNVCSVAGNCTATTNYCYVYVGASGTPSTGNSIPVPPGGEYLRSTGAVPTDAIKATCAGTGDKYYLSVQ